MRNSSILWSLLRYSKLQEQSIFFLNKKKPILLNLLMLIYTCRFINPVHNSIWDQFCLSNGDIRSVLLCNLPCTLWKQCNCLQHIELLHFTGTLCSPVNTTRVSPTGRPSIHGTGTPWMLDPREILLVRGRCGLRKRRRGCDDGDDDDDKDEG